jgi:hypothetical protein
MAIICNGSIIDIEKKEQAGFTHHKNPVVIFGVGSCTTPCSSTDGRMSNTCRTEATVRNAWSLAKCRPGQMLKTLDKNQLIKC